MKETLKVIDNDNKKVDIFCIFEETNLVNGKEPPSGKKDLYEFMDEKRIPFIQQYHVVAVHPTKQVYIT